MDVFKAIGELRAELARIDAAIERIERMKVDERKKPRVWNSASRKSAAERMRAYWAARKASSNSAGGAG